jgi:hypothetical protein
MITIREMRWQCDLPPPKRNIPIDRSWDASAPFHAQAYFYAGGTGVVLGADRRFPLSKAADSRLGAPSLFKLRAAVPHEAYSTHRSGAGQVSRRGAPGGAVAAAHMGILF